MKYITKLLPKFSLKVDGKMNQKDAGTVGKILAFAGAVLILSFAFVAFRYGLTLH